jgi:hypothetical protein
MHGIFMKFLLVTIAINVCVDCKVTADEPQGHLRAEQALQLTRDVARSLRIVGIEAGDPRFKLVESPLQRFSNPVVGEFYAHLFIWTNRGRPVAAASIQKWYAPNQALHVELQSLSTGRLSADYEQTRFWHPQEAGVTFHDIPNAAAPAPFTPARTRQLRQLARQFRAKIKAINRGNEIDEELRLLSKPIYRYNSDSPAIQDGAIFSFVRGTDPELLMLTEARKAGDRFAWQYAFAPMNSFEFHTLHNDHEVWQKPQLAPPWPNVQDPTKSYLLIVNFGKRFLPKTTP